MGWHSGNCNEVARISCFDEAERVWNDAKPWKDELTTWRPLAARRDKNKRIVRINDGDGYMCVLYSTPLVKYHRDGQIELSTHNSNMSHQFAWKVRPTGTNIVSRNGRMYWQFTGGEKEELFVRDAHEPLRISPIKQGIFALLNEPAQDFEFVLDLKEAAAVRKKLSHYKRWYEITTKLIGAKRYPYPYPSKQLITELIISPENTELFHAAFIQDLGPVDKRLLSVAYDICGAYKHRPIPITCLPRVTR